MPEGSAYDEVEQGWLDLIAAANRIQTAANQIKAGSHSVDGYEIERALKKHRPELMRKHLEGLQSHRRQNRL